MRQDQTIITKNKNISPFNITGILEKIWPNYQKLYQKYAQVYHMFSDPFKMEDNKLKALG